MEQAGDEKPRIEEVSLKYGVMSSQTAFCALEKLKHKVEGEAKQVLIPVNVGKLKNNAFVGSKLINAVEIRGRGGRC